MKASEARNKTLEITDSILEEREIEDVLNYIQGTTQNGEYSLNLNLKYEGTRERLLRLGYKLTQEISPRDVAFHLSEEVDGNASESMLFKQKLKQYTISWK